MGTKAVKFILTVYLLFGILIGALVSSSRHGAFRWDTTATLSTLGFHIPFIAFAAFLYHRSVPISTGYRYGLSPGGWGIGLSLSYLVGFVVLQFVL
jgi:uncharacterized membrane protein YhdT